MRGFTLIELLVVVTISGILAALSLPQFQAYRARAFDFRAQVDLRNAAMAEELYFSGWESYLSCEAAQCLELEGLPRISKGVTLSISATPSGFTGDSEHAQGSGRTFHWDSSKGGMQGES